MSGETDTEEHLEDYLLKFLSLAGYSVLFILTAIMGTLLFTGLFGTLLALSEHNLDRASNFVNILSSIGTITLVALTAYYSYNTKRQVDEAEKSRKAEAKRKREEDNRRKQNLRKALHQEILQTPDIREGAETVVLMDEPVPQSVYRRNSDRLGILHRREVEAVVEYYNTAALVESMASVYRINMDGENLSKTNEEQLNSFLRLLADKQDRALKILEEEIEDESGPTTESGNT